ncbi:MAG TPA: hypothetical protein VI565_00615 [Burkholderiales bacterium]|jgi:hypothetical protein|nr:hypothetical protein [Burkholderiales bacterium]
MAFKVFAGIVAIVLLLAYLAPIIIKLRDPALTGVVLIGITMMLVDLWQSLKSKGD